MATITQASSSRGKPARPKAAQRLDIQGLRMVAVTLVVLSHLFQWPRGGFVGVDVFFVISGFLITGSLVHTFERTGRISFSSFYRRRIRRIVPAASLVLVATCIAAYFIFAANRFKSTTLDALWAFLFASNWRFGIEGTDYFDASGPASPLRHYWSLSVEEQFYFVWPAVILAIGLIAVRHSWSRKVRIAVSTSVMGVIVAISFAYSMLDTVSNPSWAYFSTLTRVWELGVGALLAITISYFERIPNQLRPFIAWAGLVTVAVGAFAITETGGGFPAPWAAVPVLGAALIIVSGVEGKQKYLQVLTNRVSTYIGDISYSLYLWHWPIIIILGTLMDRNIYYFASALFLMFGCSIGAYHFFENPIRASKWLETTDEKKDRGILDLSRWRLRTMKMSESNQTIGIASLALVTAGLVAFAIVPMKPVAVPPTATVSPKQDAAEAKIVGAKPTVGPAQEALAKDIAAAAQATSWPELTPSMDDAINGLKAPREISACWEADRPKASACTWGAPNAPRTIMLLGDSVAGQYVQPLKAFAENSGGQWKVRTEAMSGCPFVDITVREAFEGTADICPRRKKEAIQNVNQERPDVVIIANAYGYESVSSDEWAAGMTRLTTQFSNNVGMVSFLSPPPADVTIGSCFSKISTPADCISRVKDLWYSRADIEKSLAKELRGSFIDSRSWFCTADDYCPSFVGVIPVKMDSVHMTPQYAEKIAGAVAESLQMPGVLYR
ncbi:acyltransferase family protein [Rhodococcus sp. NPDC056960]|uniref:acyltransferase family protein n=1 Tax=Rhodococcus sp. NPDC056960 TaxID=3345982 RepID=UPI0036358B60